MTDRATATGWLRDLATDQLDEALAEAGFTRRANSTTYSRKVADGRQSIHLDLLVRPNYARDSFHLSLRTTLVYPRLAGIMADLLGDDPTAVVKGIVHGAVLDTIIANPEMLLFKDKQQLQSLASRIRDHLIDDVLPYLDERNSIVTLIERMWQSWSRNRSATRTAGNWPVTVAAGQLAAGHADLARQTLEDCYPEGSVERIKYRRALEVAGAS